MEQSIQQPPALPPKPIVIIDDNKPAKRRRNYTKKTAQVNDTNNEIKPVVIPSVLDNQQQQQQQSVDEQQPKIKKPRRKPVSKKPKSVGCVCETDINDHMLHITNNLQQFFNEYNNNNNESNNYNCNDVSNLVFQTEHLLSHLKVIELLLTFKTSLQDNMISEIEDVIKVESNSDDSDNANTELNSLNNSPILQQPTTLLPLNIPE